MKKSLEHIKLLMKKINLPEDAVQYFLELENRLIKEGSYSDRILELKKEYMSEGCESNAIFDKLNAMAEELGISNFTLHFVFFMNCSDILLERYHEKGISEEIYWDTMSDLRCKLIECINCKEVYGTFTGGWYNGFFRMTRFALGRLQFEETEFSREGYEKGGYAVKEGDKVINIHIPSSGPLTADLRLDAYRRAYNFFKQPDKNHMGFVCGSWLLYPDHTKFLPATSNILSFMEDFDIIDFYDEDKFGNSWRIFAKDSEKPLEEWPTDTGLRRAYVDWMKNGGKTGSGFGIIVFDGEKIVK